ncbi:MAG TPA: FtsH protease activity modulator HflK [Spirochaetia bacterium]|nr:FtsH protease activity modulator HflK [Spirochaetia bacterium]
MTDVTPRRQLKLTPALLLIGIGVILCLILLFSSFFVVDQKEEAVVLNFGKFSRVLGPGLHFKIPFGVEKNYNVPTQRILKEEFGFRTERPGVVSTFSTGDYSSESIMLTGDLNIVDVEWIIQYQITDARAWLFNVADQHKTIRDISQSVISLLVGDRTIFDVIGAERANIEVQGQAMMNDLYKTYGLGVRVTTVKLQNIVPPKGSVQDAFEDVNKAIQDRSRMINEGKEAYNQAIPKASGQADQTIQEAQGYAVERVNKALGDVARFNAVLGEYRKAPDIVRTRLYYEMYDSVFSGAEGTDLIDKNLKNFLPLKSMGGSPPPPVPSAAGGADTGAQPGAQAAPAAPAAPAADASGQQGGTQ